MSWLLRHVPWWWWTFWAVMFVTNGFWVGWWWALFYLALWIGSYYLGAKLYDWTHPK